LAVVAWLGLFVQRETRDFVIQHQLAVIVQWTTLNASALVVVLAVLSVVAVLAEVIRSSRRLSKVRRRLVRSLRITQRLVLGSRAV